MFFHGYPPCCVFFSASILWKTVGYAVWNCRSYCNCNCRCEVLCVHCLSHFCTLILRFDLDGTSCQRSGKGNFKKTVLGVDDDHDLSFEFFSPPISFSVVSGRGCCAIRYPLNLWSDSNLSTVYCPRFHNWFNNDYRLIHHAVNEQLWITKAIWK